MEAMMEEHTSGESAIDILYTTLKNFYFNNTILCFVQ